MNILKKFFSFSIGSFGAAIIGFLSIPIITRLVSPSEYGLVSIFISVGLILSTLVLSGMDQALSRFYLQEKLKSLFVKTFSLSLLAFFIIAISLLLFQDYIYSFIGTKFSYIFYIICYIFSALVFRYVLVILRMKQLGYRYSAVYIGQRGLEFFLVIILLTLVSKSHIQIISGTIFSMLVLGIVGVFLILNSNSNNNSINKNKNLQVTIPALIKYGYPLMVATLIMSIYQNIDKLILKGFVENHEIGIYSAALQIAFSMNIIQSAFSSYWIPLSIERYEKNPSNTDFFKKISVYITFAMVSLGALLIAFREIIVILLGNDYRSASSILPMLILMPVLMTMSETITIGINFKMKSYLHIYIAAISLILNITLLFILVPLFGLKGASISLGTSYLVYYILRDYLGNKLYKIANDKKKTYITIISLYVYAMATTFVSNSIISVIGCIIVFLILFCFYYKDIKSLIKILSESNKFRKGVNK